VSPDIISVVLPSPFHFPRPDFAQIVSRIFERGRFLTVGVAAEELQRQFSQIGREAVVCESCANMAVERERSAAAQKFEVAVWFYPADESNDDHAAEELSRYANEIVLTPGAGANVVKRRPQLVESFRRLGFLPDYRCNVSEIHPGAIYLRKQSGEPGQEFVPAVESGFARLNSRLGDLQRALYVRTSELEAAYRHIAIVEEKLLKLKQYQREVKLLKEQKQALRKSVERKIGQILLAPYRLPQKLVREIRKGVAGRDNSMRRAAPASAYEKWLHEHCATPERLEMMRAEWRGFTNQPLVSIITPVFDTPVTWLREAVESVLRQAYENWELVLVDDGSTNADLLRALPALATQDRRIRLVKLDGHQGISAALNRGLDLASGEWVTFLDHDDVLEPDALFQNVRLLQENPGIDLIYSDEDKLNDEGFDSPMLKPDWSPDFFLSCNYLCHMIFLRRKLAQEVGKFRPEFDGSQDYDFLLRISERTNRIMHIPQVLYHWRRSQSSSASNVRQKPGQLDASLRAIEDHFNRRGENAHVTVDWRTHAFCVRRELLEAKKISIVIRSQHDVERLSRCVESVTAKTSYPSYEIVVVQQKSESVGHSLYRVVQASHASSVAALNNCAVQQTDSPWLLFLDDTIEVIDHDWLTIMAEHVQRPEVGAVGPRLVNRNGTIEHAGIVLGVGGIAQPAFRGFPAEHPGVNRQLQMVRNYSAVSGACMLVRREVFEEIGGFDETLSQEFADIDLCLKMRRQGCVIVYTPLTKLYWDAPVCDKSDTSSEAIMRKRWSNLLERDPYYNPNLSRERADFSLGK
jgi:GT2 family glycosyltransferase